jgi:hypothetical protein
MCRRVNKDFNPLFPLWGENPVEKCTTQAKKTPFPNHLQLKNNAYLLKTNFYIFIFSWNGSQMLFLVP